MQIILLFFSLLCLLTTPAQAVTETKISAHCPKPNELMRTASTNSWSQYRYSGQSFVNLPAASNSLHFTGDSNADKPNYFYGATWTDRTFLCLYNYLDEAIVIYEGQLSPLVSRCYFEKPGNSECISSNPDACPITCELESSSV